MHGVFLIAACVSILAVALICIFLFANGQDWTDQVSDRDQMEANE